MLVLALSEAAKTTIVYIALWFVVIPALVTGLIVFAVIQARGEKSTYDDIRRSRRR
jgi:heme/copper-type cytochrome/quinol oxidase subunit 2